MGSILGLLGPGAELAGDVLNSILGGGSGNSQSSENPLASLLGGGQDGISSGGGSGLSTLMNVASLAAMFL